MKFFSKRFISFSCLFGLTFLIQGQELGFALPQFQNDPLQNDPLQNEEAGESPFENHVEKVAIVMFQRNNKAVILTVEPQAFDHTVFDFDIDSVYKLLTRKLAGSNKLKMKTYSADEFYALIKDGTPLSDFKKIFVVVPNTWIGKSSTGLEKENIIQLRDNRLFSFSSDEIEGFVYHYYVHPQTNVETNLQTEDEQEVNRGENTSDPSSYYYEMAQKEGEKEHFSDLSEGSGRFEKENSEEIGDINKLLPPPNRNYGSLGVQGVPVDSLMGSDGQVSDELEETRGIYERATKALFTQGHFTQAHLAQENDLAMTTSAYGGTSSSTTTTPTLTTPTLTTPTTTTPTTSKTTTKTTPEKKAETPVQPPKINTNFHTIPLQEYQGEEPLSPIITTDRSITVPITPESGTYRQQEPSSKQESSQQRSSTQQRPSYIGMPPEAANRASESRAETPEKATPEKATPEKALSTPLERGPTTVPSAQIPASNVQAATPSPAAVTPSAAAIPSAEKQIPQTPLTPTNVIPTSVSPPNASAPLQALPQAPQQLAPQQLTPVQIISPQQNIVPTPLSPTPLVPTTQQIPPSGQNVTPQPPSPQPQNINAQNPNAQTLPNVTIINEPQEPVEPQVQTPVSAEPQDVLINFNNVSIIEYLGFISKLTGKNFVFDEADLNFNVTIVSNEPTTINNVMTALLQALRVQGLGLMEVGNNLIIHRNRKVNSPADVVVGTHARANSEIVTQIFRLTNSDPTKMADIIRPMLSDMALVAPIPETGHLLVTDLTANVNKISDLISNLDSSRSGFEIGRYVIQSTTLDTTVELAKQIMGPIAQGKTLIFTPDPATNSVFVVSTPYLLQRTLGVLEQIDVQQGVTTVFPENLRMQGRTPESITLPNGAVLTGGVRQPDGSILYPGGFSVDANGNLRDSKGNLITQINPEAKLGIGKEATATQVGRAEPILFKIIKLRNRKGDKLSTSFQSIGASLASSVGAQTNNIPLNNLIAALNSVQWIDTTNSLVFSGTQRVLEDIEQLVIKLDIPIRQVLIEMLILDTTITDSLNYGVEWGARFSQPDVAGAESFLGTATSPLNTVLNNINNVDPRNTGQLINVNNLDASGLAQQNGFSLGIIGRNLVRGSFIFPTIGALVQILHTDGNTNIVMNPKIIVEENATAEIFVGFNIPFQGQTVVNDLGVILTQNFEYRDVGTRLKVTPTISADDIITLEIEEEVSDLVTVIPLIQSAGGGVTTATGLVSVTSATSSNTTSKQTTTTRVHLPDGYFVILSGMMKDENITNNQQIPCLGGLPLIGGLFKQDNLVDDKRNLMLFIRPLIVENDEIHHQTKREQDMWREKTRIKNREDYEVEEALEFFNLKHYCDPNRFPEYNY